MKEMIIQPGERVPLSEMGKSKERWDRSFGEFASALDMLVLECLRFPSGDGSGWWELQL